MPDYRFNGPYPVLYPGRFKSDGTPLDVKPGDVLTLDSAPNDGNWVEVNPADQAPEFAEPDAPVSTSRAKRSS